MTAATPGPWIRKDSFGPKGDGSLIGPVNGSPVCSVTGYYGREGHDANANLIAAAPEILAALISLTDTYWGVDDDRNGDGIDPPPSMIVEARAAIARAKCGEAR